MSYASSFVIVDNRGTTILMATHAKDIVKLLPHRIIMLDHGKVVTDTARESDSIEDIEKHDIGNKNNICEIEELTDQEKQDLKDEVFNKDDAELKEEEVQDEA